MANYTTLSLELDKNKKSEHFGNLNVDSFAKLTNILSSGSEIVSIAPTMMNGVANGSSHLLVVLKEDL